MSLVLHALNNEHAANLLSLQFVKPRHQKVTFRISHSSTLREKFCRRSTTAVGTKVYENSIFLYYTYRNRSGPRGDQPLLRLDFFKKTPFSFAPRSSKRTLVDRWMRTNRWSAPRGAHFNPQISDNLLLTLLGRKPLTRNAFKVELIAVKDASGLEIVYLMFRRPTNNSRNRFPTL